MVQFNLLAFVPFSVLLGTALVAAATSIWIRFAHGGAARQARPERNAQILYFSAATPRRRVAGETAPLAVYARAPLAG